MPIESTCTLLKKLFLTFLKVPNLTSNARKQRTKLFLFSLQQLSIEDTSLGEVCQTVYRNKQTKILLFHDMC